jgi:phosphoribosylformylglycinamidine synthase subunit PurS
MKAIVTVMLKNGVLDTQGRAVAGALGGLGFAGLGDVRVGKSIEIDLGAMAEAEAREKVAAMCQALLVNPVIESYTVAFSSAGAGK